MGPGWNRKLSQGFVQLGLESRSKLNTKILIHSAAVFEVLVYSVGKVSGSFLGILSIKKVSIELPRSAVVSTQRCVHRAAKVHSWN